MKSNAVKGATKFYRVQPPAGRHHDSLWEIAQRHLGDGRRYQEIYDLNKDRVQPDGSMLTKASLIRPGWILEMPADAAGGDLVGNPAAPAAGAPRTPTATPRTPSRAARPSGGAQQGRAAEARASSAVRAACREARRRRARRDFRQRGLELVGRPRAAYPAARRR